MRQQLDISMAATQVRSSETPVLVYTVMRCLTTGIRSEKCTIRRFRPCANVIECTYTNLDSIAYYTPSLYGIAYCSYATNLYGMLLY